MYSYETSDRKRCHHKAKLHYTHLLSICMPAYISLSSVDQSLVYSLTTSTNSKQTRRSTLSDSTVVSPAPPWLIFAPNTAKHLVLTVLWQSLDRFSHDFQHLAKTLSGQNQTTFFRWVNPFCRHLAFCDVGSEAKVTFLNLPPTLERVRKPKA